MTSRHAAQMILILAALLLPDVVHAQAMVHLTFNQTAQSAVQGGLLTFSGTLSVTGGPNNVYLAGDSVDPSPGFGIVGFDDPTPELLMLDDQPFFLNFPSQISASDPKNPWTLDFFTIKIGPQALPGTYLGTFTVLGGTVPGAQDVLASATFRINITAPPLGLLQGVLVDLSGFRATVNDQKDGQKLDAAIDRLSNALDASLWLDQSHPEPKHGEKAFAETRIAVNTLMDLIKTKKSTIPDATLKAFIDRIVEAARLLAVTVIGDVSGKGDPKKLAAANGELAKGDGQLTNGNSDNAIEYYKLAWKHALEALNKA